MLRLCLVVVCEFARILFDDRKVFGLKFDPTEPTQVSVFSGYLSQVFNTTIQQKRCCHSVIVRKKREVISDMASMLQDQPFKNRAHVKAEIRRCAMASSVLSFLSFLFVAIGIIGEASNITLGLTSLAWFLLAIFAIIHAIVPTLHLVVAKHFLGTEAESKKE